MRLAGMLRAAAAVLVIAARSGRTPLSSMPWWGALNRSGPHLRLHERRGNRRNQLARRRPDARRRWLGVGFDITPVVPGALSTSNGGLADLKLESP